MRAVLFGAVCVWGAGSFLVACGTGSENATGGNPDATAEGSGDEAAAPIRCGRRDRQRHGHGKRRGRRLVPDAADSAVGAPGDASPDAGAAPKAEGTRESSPVTADLRCLQTPRSRPCTSAPSGRRRQRLSALRQMLRDQQRLRVRHLHVQLLRRHPRPRVQQVADGGIRRKGRPVDVRGMRLRRQRSPHRGWAAGRCRRRRPLRQRLLRDVRALGGQHGDDANQARAILVGAASTLFAAIVACGVSVKHAAQSPDGGAPDASSSSSPASPEAGNGTNGADRLAPDSPVANDGGLDACEMGLNGALDDTRVTDAQIGVAYTDAGAVTCYPSAEPAVCAGSCGNNIRDTCSTGMTGGGSISVQEECDGLDRRITSPRWALPAARSRAAVPATSTRRRARRARRPATRRRVLASLSARVGRGSRRQRERAWLRLGGARRHMRRRPLRSVRAGPLADQRVGVPRFVRRLLRGRGPNIDRLAAGNERDARPRSCAAQRPGSSERIDPDPRRGVLGHTGASQPRGQCRRAARGSSSATSGDSPEGANQYPRVRSTRVVGRSPLFDPFEILDEDFERALDVAADPTRGMRSDQQIGRSPERTVGRERFAFEHVEGGTGEPPLQQRGAKCRFVDDTPARQVDEHRVRLHRRGHGRREARECGR